MAENVMVPIISNQDAGMVIAEPLLVGEVPVLVGTSWVKVAVPEEEDTVGVGLVVFSVFSTKTRSDLIS